MNPIMKLKTEKSPRETIYEHFEQILPIKGGWGYNKDDAVIIDSNDVSINKSEIFNGIKYENEFIEKRLFEEMIVTKSFEEGYSDIKWDKTNQELIRDDGKHYDRITVNVSAFLYTDWLKLKEEWENNYDNPSFDKRAHEQRRQEKIYRFKSEFWFEISSFFGKYDGVIIKDPETGEDIIAKIEIDEEVLSKQTNNVNLTLEEKIEISTPLDTINGHKIFLIDGIYYIYCKNKNSLDSAIGSEQAYSIARMKNTPCFNKAIEKINQYSIYFLDDKYHVSDEADKYLGYADSISMAKRLINNDIWDKKFNITENINIEESEFSIFIESITTLISFLVKSLSFIAIIYFVLMYFNHIPNGKYMAQTIEINGNIIGDGTEKAKRYDFILHKNNVLVNKTPYLLDKDNSNLFEKKYFNMLNRDEELTITSMGNIEINNKTEKITEKIKIYED